ncbi:MAG: CCA tRNA nucleotidyltransferase [Candidatus Solibacter usitatus]|nr:CCA tRNA nucleotidyltransferase [Candidatus Solibacter usitatus]
MSDYMFMLENHLNAEQTRFMGLLQGECDAAGVNVFLAGGAMRDMLGGFPIRDLDFVVETNAVKLARKLAKESGAEIVSTDDLRKSVEFLLPAGSTVQVAMARSEKYSKPGKKPHIEPASIHEDLRCRDFTINSIALSLGKASRGLLLDPTNGLADLERREMRAVHNYVLYDDPIRLWRLIRFKVRLSFAIEERTAAQYANAREAEMEQHIPRRALFDQLKFIAQEQNPADVLKALEEERLLGGISPALTGQKLNLHGFSKLFKARQLLPFGVDIGVDNFALLMAVLTEKLSAKETKGMMKAVEATRAESEIGNKLETKAKKAEKALKSAKLKKPSQVFQACGAEAGETVLFLLMNTAQRTVADRIRNYLQKYLSAAAEITDKILEAEGLAVGTPKFAKVKADRIAQRLDRRQPKPPPPPEIPPPPPPQLHARRFL